MNGRLDAVKKAFITWAVAAGADVNEVMAEIGGLSEEELLQRMSNARLVEDVVEEVKAMKRQAELGEILDRVATGVFTDTDDLRFLIRPKRGGSPERQG